MNDQIEEAKNDLIPSPVWKVFEALRRDLRPKNRDLPLSFRGYYSFLFKLENLFRMKPGHKDGDQPEYVGEDYVKDKVTQELKKQKIDKDFEPVIRMGNKNSITVVLKGRPYDR